MDEQAYRSFDPWRTAPVREESRRQIVKSHFFNVDELRLSSADNETFNRSTIETTCGDTVGILAFTEDDTIPLIEQYRLPTRRWTLEIPSGHAKTLEERPQDVAQRKLKEQVGFQASKLELFARFINTPSFSNEYTSLFRASGLIPVERNTDAGLETPRSQLRFFTLEQAYAMVLNATIIDADSVIAILRMKNGI